MQTEEWIDGEKREVKICSEVWAHQRKAGGRPSEREQRRLSRRVNISDEQRVESVLRRPMLIPKALPPVVKSMPARHTTFNAQ